MESLAFNIAEKVLERLASRAYEEICLAWGVKGELKRLKETLKTITILLLDAEEKQTKDCRISHWLGMLKDLCYDADDVLSEFEYRELRMQVLNRGSIKGKVRSFFSLRNSPLFRFKMGHKIKEIRERLDKIALEKDKFSLLERNGELHGVHNRRESHSIVRASNVIGREDEAEQIIFHLLKDNGQGEDNPSVISIVGLGGLGKTTLAKLIYNDTRVVDTFNGLRMWVCVSNDFDNKRLVRDIIESTTKEKCGHHESLDRIQTKLQDALRDKRFLLVLDDVWDNEPMGVTITKWMDLKTLFSVGAHGSKIIVTTRSESAASIMGSIYKHPLKALPPEGCMDLFIKMTFEKGEVRQYPHLKEIAEDIVEKCGGVPLAITTVGSLLRLKRELHDWLHVRDNDIWKLKQGDDGILPALKLSYDALPPYLKPCFAYCSLFPKDYKFLGQQLVLNWMAEGFISPEGNQETAEIGMDDIRELCSRSLFQKTAESLGYIKFNMHDLVHDLAISVAQVECSSMNFRPSNACERVRHVSLSSKDLSNEEEYVPEFILQLHKVRTILVQQGYGNQPFFKTCISRFKYLRTLDISCSSLEELPSSIGNLSHLRYLNLSHNPMIEKLPNSFCKLHNLQTLLLSGCENLQELPKEIGNLINLRTLAITTNQMYLPKEIEGLTSLQILVVCICSNIKSVGGVIHCLTNLRELQIVECRNLEFLWGNMEQLISLKILSIDYCPNLDLESGNGIRGLRNFAITNSDAEALPSWLQNCADTLESMEIRYCGYLKELPEWLQNLKLLQRLVIEHCPRLLAVPEGMHQLTALRELEISECPELTKSKRREGEGWSKNIAHVTKLKLDGEDVELADNDDY